MSFLKFQNSKLGTQNTVGFTLVEILIAISIIALISAVAIPNLRNFNQGQELDLAKAQLFDDLRLAKSKADSGVVCPGSVVNAVALDISYSVVLDRYSYTTKYECVDRSRDVPVYYVGSQTQNYPSATSVEMEQNDFCQNSTYGTTITFKNRSCPIGSTTCKGVEITCAGAGNEPGQVYDASTPFVITLQNERDMTRVLNISAGGAIYEN